MIVNRCWNCMEDVGDNVICPHCGFNPQTAQPNPYALQPNTILHGKYLVGSVLGQGGFGITYIGLDLTLEMKVAIKEYFPMNQATRNSQFSSALQWKEQDGSQTNWRTGCSQFLAEARKMAKINAIPEIVGVRDTFEENNTAYIVMDYVPGVTLKEYVRKNGCLSFSECVELLLPVIAGLDGLHHQGIIHRDISPDNLMITPEGKVYLLDLGAAKDMKDAAAGAAPASKIGFSPLEQNAGGNNIGAWTDVYALAASIYYCVFGKLVPPAMERLEEDTLSFSHKTKKPLTKEQIEVMKKALAVTRELRYQNAMYFYMALRDSIQSKKNTLWWKIAGAVGGALLVAAGIAALLVYKPWLPSVVEWGDPAHGSFFDSDFVTIKEEYLYYVDLDDSLVQCVYDSVDQTFYVDNYRVIFSQDEDIAGDGVCGLYRTEDKLIFSYSGGTNSQGELLSSYVYTMDYDGGNISRLFEIDTESSIPQYVRLSNNTEYLYFLKSLNTKKSDDEALVLSLYRYNIQEDTLEQILEDPVMWYTIAEKWIYFNYWDEEAEHYVLCRASLDGDDITVLDTIHSYWNGFYRDGQLYLIQNLNASGVYSPGLVACDADAQPLQEEKGIFGVDWNTVQWTEGGGWIFYSNEGSQEISRIRLDGTENSTILTGYTCGSLNYQNGWLYFTDGMLGEDGSFTPYQAYFAGEDGSWVISCGFEPKTLVDSQGMHYVVRDGQAQIVGYTGTATDVIIPLEFNGYPLNDAVDWDTFTWGVTSNVQFYAQMDPSELTCIRNADGITITGYTGMKTGAYSFVAIPSTIEGTPVVRIDDGVFADCTFTGVYLPKQLEEIGVEAFDSCPNLSHVVFPDTLRLIDDYAFFNCPFEDVEIVLPDGLTHMGQGVFMFSEPKSVYLPASLTNISGGFLAMCGGEYIVDPNHKQLKSEYSVIFSKDSTVLYAFPYDCAGNYVVPDTVKKIYSGTFYGSLLVNVKLPEGLTTIGSSAFMYSTELEKINIPRSVKEIGDQAFYNTSLKQVTIPRGIVDRDDAFDADTNVYFYK